MASFHARTNPSTKSLLSSRSWSLGPVTSGGSQLDVQNGDAKGLDLFGDVLGSQHSGVGRRFVTICFDFHSTGHTAQGFAARQVCDMDKGVVERGINVGYTKHFNTITYLRSQLDLDLLGLLLLSLTWSHYGRLDFFEKKTQVYFTPVTMRKGPM